jgi:Domain of unknown function (DUF4381)
VTGPLDKLHDFYQPPPPAWIPQTIGWYELFAIAGLLILWLIIHSVRRWYANAYRREALRELEVARPEEFSALLKRTALSVWPREKVASLSGEAWLTFLNQTATGELFRESPSNRVEEPAFRGMPLSGGDQQALRTATAEWIRRHRVQA